MSNNSYYCCEDEEEVEEVVEDSSCCCGEEGVEEVVEDSSCCRDENEEKVKETKSCCFNNFKLIDYSKVKNPKNSKTEINDLLLKKFQEKSEKLNIVNIGYGKIAEDVFNNNETIEYPNVIILTFPITMNIIDEIPSDKAQKFNNELYETFGNITYELSDFLRKEGFGTQVIHPLNSSIDLSKLGQNTNIGYIGKNGLLITPDLGPRLKIAGILTTINNLPSNQTNQHEWIKNYCKRCNKCIKACKENALIEDDNKLNNAKIIEEKCIGCNQGCTYCIESCPFFEKGYFWVKEKQRKLIANLKEKGKI